MSVFQNALLFGGVTREDYDTRFRCDKLSTLYTNSRPPLADAKVITQLSEPWIIDWWAADGRSGLF